MIRTRRRSVPKTFVSYFLSSGVLNVFRTSKNFFSNKSIGKFSKWRVETTETRWSKNLMNGIQMKADGRGPEIQKWTVQKGKPG